MSQEKPGGLCHLTAVVLLGERCPELPWAAILPSQWWAKGGTWVVVLFLSSQIQPLFLWRWESASTEQLDFTLSVSTDSRFQPFFDVQAHQNLTKI